MLAKDVEDIPAFIDHSNDNYAQMIENIQREDLTPMEIGKWCLARIDTGEEAKAIAKHLGKPDSFVSLHKELPKLPPVIMALYVENVVRSPRLLVDLKRANKIDAEATAKFCGRIQLKGGATKKEIDGFIADLKKSKALGKDGEDSGEAATIEPTTKPTASKGTEKPAQGEVLVRVGSDGKVGVLVLDKPSENEEAWVNFDGSVALMDMSQPKPCRRQDPVKVPPLDAWSEPATPLSTGYASLFLFGSYQPNRILRWFHSYATSPAN